MASLPDSYLHLESSSNYVELHRWDENLASVAAVQDWVFWEQVQPELLSTDPLES